MTHPKKLIEVALPLEAINKHATRENYIYKGNPSAIHKWWAQRPLAACRAVLFAQLVDDPSAHPERFPTEAAQELERQRLFRIIEDLVKWENINNETVLAQARAEIRRCAGPEGPPPLLDPFAGGGSIPLEAQRLGLEAHAHDLNPVAVLINKALIEIPPRWAGMPPVHPGQPQQLIQKRWQGAQGLAEDVRYYGQWMRDEAEKRIGHLYPKVVVTEALLAGRPDLKAEGLAPGDELTVIAWLWARMVKCPNPACGAQMPLARSFAVSTKKGRQAWVEPVVERGSGAPTVRFEVRAGKGKPREGTVDRRGAVCVCCRTPAPLDYIRAEGRAGRMSAQLMAVVADGKRGRVYLSPDKKHKDASEEGIPIWEPGADMSNNPRHMTPPIYGMRKFSDIFTSRQLVALALFSDLLFESRARVHCDAALNNLCNDDLLLDSGGNGALAYADAVITYLMFSLDKYAMYGCALVPWYSKEDRPSMLFGRQAISMVWDFTEVNPFADIGGSFGKSVAIVADSLEPLSGQIAGVVVQEDAAALSLTSKMVISTDPPYYDNVPYADLSDFFYVWQRRSLQSIYPNLFRTLLVPKAAELVADPYRHGGKEEAERHFLDGMRQAFSRMRVVAHSDYPITVYYAFKQSESNFVDEDQSGDDLADVSVVSTGWETMLEGLIQSGFTITGTWPMRTERSGRLRDTGSNALASSIVLVCRPRLDDAPLTTRRDFINALRRELPAALRNLQRGNIAPVDMAQASIGPGMAIYSRCRRVLEADGSSMRVRTALALINQALDEYLTEQEGEYDPATRWALAWFEQFAFEEGPFGDAETLSKAKNTSVEGMAAAGIVAARGGKVRLLRREELPADWNPSSDSRLTVWEATQRLIRTVQERGEVAAGALIAQLGGLGEAARDLAYRLYTLCERKGWAQEAMPYNALVVGWSEVSRLAEEQRRSTPVQGRMEL